jgi:divinyl protochlorophyllide a 8-vinyl-reductase
MSQAAVAQRGRIGPNAVLQLRTVLLEQEGRAAAERLFTAAGQAEALDDPPSDMVDQAVPAALFSALFRLYPRDRAIGIAEEAGRRVADYVIANRIPAPAVRLLSVLPPILAAPMLFQAIERNAWTFAGSGLCTARAEKSPQIEIHGNPLKMPGSVWHRAVFERLFRRLVCAGTRVRAMPGAYGSDRFVVSYGRPCGSPKARTLCLNCVCPE